MKVLFAQVNTTVGDIKGNVNKILLGIAKGKDCQADLVIFPELTIVGYPPEDLLLLPNFIDEAEKALEEVISATQNIAVVVGTVRRHHIKGEKFLCNSAAIIENGHLIGFQDKSLLPTYDVFDERRFFEPAREVYLWDICRHSVGVTICEDIWQHSALLGEVSYLRDPVEELARLHPQFVINLSSSPFSCGKIEKRLRTSLKAVHTLRCPFLLCNQVGGNDSLIFDGSSLCINAEGVVIGQAKSFEEDFLFVDLPESSGSEAGVLMPDLNSSFTGPGTVSVSDDLRSRVVNEKDGNQEILYKALVLGIRDYFQKSGFKKACLGLSGGIDSALVLCLAVEALGRENVVGVAMPSRYSSPSSLSDAKQIAEVLEIQLLNIPIEKPFCSFLELLAPEFGDRSPDVTEENIQARIRGLLLMSLSNKFNYIVLSTGNKSELAVGYATLYGDMCGGIAVIGDLTKQQVYALSRWINRNNEVIPWSTINKEPSAELRPNQKDSDSLPDYTIIDHVLEAYVEENQSPEFIIKRFGYSPEIVHDLIKKIHRNEFKRRQGPLALRVTEKAFSAGRRFPIIQKFI